MMLKVDQCTMKGALGERLSCRHTNMRLDDDAKSAPCPKEVAIHAGLGRILMWTWVRLGLELG